MGQVVLLIVSFAVILTGALVFTNAVEWVGRRLDMGQGAVGSLLAAVGTAMPETLIPIVAILGGSAGSEEVAIGAIIGAPFLLGTLAMMLVGVSALGFNARRPQGDKLEAHAPTLERDLRFFIIFFGIGILLGIGAPEGLQIPLALVFILAYGWYVRRTLGESGEVQEAEEIGSLYFDRTEGIEPPRATLILQLIVGLAGIVGGAHLFVEELIGVADSIGVEPLILSLVLAPLATELPEKVNSFIWVREGKDALALGNITGAMVFQSTIPVAFGLAFTEWDLDKYAFLSGGLGVAGGLLAYYALSHGRRFKMREVALWGVFYAIFLGFVILSA